MWQLASGKTTKFQPELSERSAQSFLIFAKYSSEISPFLTQEIRGRQKTVLFWLFNNFPGRVLNATRKCRVAKPQG